LTHKSRRRWIIATLAMCGIVLGICHATRCAAAKGGDELAHLGHDPETLALYGLSRSGKYVEARTAAEALLRAHPTSYAGEYVLGYALHHGEGNLPLAARHLREARRLYDRRDEDDVWRWKTAILDELIDLAEEMDDHEEELRLLADYNDEFNPDRVAERAWPLMRLHRYNEALAAVNEAMATGREDQVREALTARCAIESERQDRTAAYEACQAALRYERSHHQDEISVSDYTNAAGAALGVFKPQEAEQVLLEIEGKLLEADDKTWQKATYSISNPWEHLTGLYLAQGRLGEARDTLDGVYLWRDSQPAWYHEQTWADVQGNAALFLLAVGRGTQAAGITARIVERPDRSGYTSGDPQPVEAGNLLLDSLAQTVAAEEQREAAACLGGRQRLAAWWASWRLRFRAWRSRRRARALVNDERTLVSSFRPSMVGSVSAPDWMTSELVDAVGPGIAAVAARQARDTETAPEAVPYLTATEAEIAFQRGQMSEALAAATRALDTLPHAEVLIRARTAALAGAAAFATGDDQRATAFYERALQLDPGVLRARRLALPVTVQSEGGAVADQVASFVRRSPRFSPQAGGFVVRIAGNASGGRACLHAPSGSVVGCADVTGKADETPTDTGRRLCAEFHHQAFAPRIDLSQAELHSLDGSPVAAGNARYVFDDLLDTITGRE
jgi:tetratricopeptide (TPR) repeat protein